MATILCSEGMAGRLVVFHGKITFPSSCVSFLFPVFSLPFSLALIKSFRQIFFFISMYLFFSPLGHVLCLLLFPITPPASPFPRIITTPDNTTTTAPAADSKRTSALWLDWLDSYKNLLTLILLFICFPPAHTPVENRRSCCLKLYRFSDSHLLFVRLTRFFPFFYNPPVIKNIGRVIAGLRYYLLGDECGVT